MAEKNDEMPAGAHAAQQRSNAMEDMVNDIVQTFMKPLQHAVNVESAGNGMLQYSFPMPRTLDKPFSKEEVADIRQRLLGVINLTLEDMPVQVVIPDEALQLDGDAKRNRLYVTVASGLISLLRHNTTPTIGHPLGRV